MSGQSFLGLQGSNKLTYYTEPIVMSANAANGQFAERPRLTEQEKKSNHIASEQKRRQAIREGFDNLAEIVPNMRGQGRSEAQMLTATVDEVRKQKADKEKLRIITTTKLAMTDVEYEESYRQKRQQVDARHENR